MEKHFDIAVVMGAKNRKSLIKATIESIRNNGFKGTMEIIVVDGGSTDGTCDWLAKQTDVLTIIQPNYSKLNAKGVKAKAHPWGEFMNIGFKACHSDYICMVSDDLILAPGCLQKGYDEMRRRIEAGEKIGGGAFYFREYPRHDYYRVIPIPKGFININHGFYYRPAMEAVGWLDEENYNFYYGDGDITMRLNLAGWRTVILENCYAAHLTHLPAKHKDKPQWYKDDEKTFAEKYPYECPNVCIKSKLFPKIDVSAFWRHAPRHVLIGYVMKWADKHIR